MASKLEATAALQSIAASRLLPVAAVDDASQALDLARALERGGVPLLEVTLRTAAGVEAIAAVADGCPDVLVGAGTVLTADDAERVILAGARFVVSPGLDPDIVAACRAHGAPALPGTCTPTEIQQALRLGVRTVKFFPAEQMGGAATLKALAAVFRDVRFVPTGGVTLANAADYLGLGCVAACGSSWLADAGLVRAGDFDEIERRARAMRELVQRR